MSKARTLTGWLIARWLGGCEVSKNEAYTTPHRAHCHAAALADGGPSDWCICMQIQPPSTEANRNHYVSQRIFGLTRALFILSHAAHLEVRTVFPTRYSTQLSSAMHSFRFCISQLSRDNSLFFLLLLKHISQVILSCSIPYNDSNHNPRTCHHSHAPAYCGSSIEGWSDHRRPSKECGHAQLVLESRSS